RQHAGAFGRRDWRTDVGATPFQLRLAMDAKSNRFAVVLDDAFVSSETSRCLAARSSGRKTGTEAVGTFVGKGAFSGGWTVAASLEDVHGHRIIPRLPSEAATV